MREWQSKSLREITLSGIKAWWHSFDSPDLWPEELDIAVRSPDAVPVCHHCMTPCVYHTWFCPVCGAAIGPYNNILPFIRVFSMGEVMRSGVSPAARFTPLTIPGYILTAFFIVWFLAPFYYFRLIKNYLQIKKHSAVSLEDSRSA